MKVSVIFSLLLPSTLALLSPPPSLCSRRDRLLSTKRQSFAQNRATATDDTGTASASVPLELVESIMVDEVNKSADAESKSSQSALPSFLQSNENQALSALNRAVEIGKILGGQVMAPILTSLAGDQDWPTQENGGWEAFWSTCTENNNDDSIGNNNINSGVKVESLSHAQRLAAALEQLGPTYVKFGQALGSRPDVVPSSLAEALSALQDDMTPFDSEVARDIILGELMGFDGKGSGGEETNTISLKDLEALVSSLTEVPVAAASIGQVYKAHLPGEGDVAVKVQRPGVRLLVERDTELLLTVAKFLESIPALPSPTQKGDNGESQGGKPKPTRLINTQLVSATQEFMSRIFEELDYRNEASNCITFAELYSEREGTSKDVSVVVPKVYLPWCTENVLVMEWIEGTKLTDVQGTATNNNESSAITTKRDAVEKNLDMDEVAIGSETTQSGESKQQFTAKDNQSNVVQQEDAVKENLELVKVAIDSTLSQLLVTGVLHADPHAGNLLKVRRDDGSVTLGYLDFGLLSTIPMQVRDALICSVALQVFERDVDAVSSLFGELRLIPQHILNDESERAALAEALHITFENSLLYPDPSISATGEEITAIPDLKFDKLLDSLSRLVPRFQFDLPPYFINNARALSTLEGIAKFLDPSFNVLTIMYPYALNRLLQNPSQSPVVERTLQCLIRSKDDGRIDREKIGRLLRDSALISGLSKRRVVWDVIKTKPGRKLTRSILGEELRNVGRNKKRRKRGRKWYYLGL